MNNIIRLKWVKNWAGIMAGTTFIFSISESVHSKTLSEAEAYIIQYAPLAQSLSRQTGIPASVILGTALIESGHGSSINSKFLKNHFGIVASKKSNSKSNYQSVYKQYSSGEESYHDFCRIIARKKYYHQLKGNTDYAAWLVAMNKYHYSSASSLWLNRIIKAIKIHALFRFDKQLPQISYSPKYNWMNIPI